MASCHFGLRCTLPESKCPSVRVYDAARLKAWVTKYRPLISKLSKRRLLPSPLGKAPPSPYALVTLLKAECVHTKPTDEAPKLYFPPTPQICSRPPLITESSLLSAPCVFRSAALAERSTCSKAAANDTGPFAYLVPKL